MAEQTTGSENLLVRLQEQSAHLLSAAGIYSVLDYAWEGENIPADDYVGLAIWSTDAPFSPDWFGWNRTTPPRMPTKQDETYYKAAEDFIGTMELAKNAIGLVLYSFEHRKPGILDDIEPFWEHSAGATVWLNIAADRIREYYVMARLGMTPEEYEAQGRRNGYMKPFRAFDRDEKPNAQKAAGDLRSDAKKLDQRRNARNTIVHEVASRQGRNALLSLKHQKEASNVASYVPRTAANFLEEAKTWKETTEAIHAERRKEMEDVIADLKSWYIISPMPRRIASTKMARSSRTASRSKPLSRAKVSAELACWFRSSSDS
jgi:hypothetical protein